MNSSCFSVRKAFTLVEVMVSTAIIGLMMIVLVSMTNQMSKTWRSSTEKIEKFQEARDGFEAMTRRISQATLNTYWDYLDASGNPQPVTVNTMNYNSFHPVTYGRRSSLAIISGPMTNMVHNALSLDSDKVRPTHGIFFQAPLGVADLGSPNFAAIPSNRNLMSSALNTWGYYLDTDFDHTQPGFVATVNASHAKPVVQARWRTRLMELRQPTEAMYLYDQGAVPGTMWYTNSLFHAYDLATDPTVRVLAENVIALVLMPKLSKFDEESLSNGIGTPNSAPVPWQLCPWYVYDSSFALEAGVSLLANPGVTASTGTQYVNPKNQLPPIIEVTMVALDERSAKKLVEKYGGTAVSNGVPPGTNSGNYLWLDQAGSAVQPTPVNYLKLFTDQSSDAVGTGGGGTPLEGALGAPVGIGPPYNDLNNLQQILIHEGLTYRIFTTNVTIRGAKWSRVQTH